jgi:hypothetical protein
LSNSLLSFSIHHHTFLQEFNPSLSGVYILEIPPPPGAKYTADVIWGKNVKSKREKKVRCKRKRKKGERKRENGK